MSNFVNMKISFEMMSELIADRFLSFDSVLLNAHYRLQRNDKWIEAKDDLENLSKWIEVKDGAISGSIWYIEDDEMIWFHNAAIRKSINSDYASKMLKATGKDLIGKNNLGKAMASGEFKAFDLAFESINPKKIYFYVRGDKGYIEKLCSEIRYFGKKSSVGFGWIKSFEIEEIDSDKSFMLDEYTVSKPLAYSKWDIDSKKVAYYRELPPYNEKKEQVMCYMPTTALIELSDNSRKNKNFKVVNDKKFLDSYVSNTKFLFDKLSANTKFSFNYYKVPKGLCKIDDSDSGAGGLFEQDVQEVICGCCGSKSKRAIIGGLKSKIFNANFNDFAKIGQERVICESCLWSVQSESCKLINFSLVKDSETLYLYGNKMQVFSEKKSENTKMQSQFRRDFIEGLDMVNIPFSVNFNTNAGKSNHIGFKGKVSVSNAMCVFNYGDSGDEYVDVELLQQALADMIRLMEETKVSKKKDSGLKKTHFLNLEDYKGNTGMAKELNTYENRVILSDFYKKYNSAVRRALHKVVL